MINWEWLILAIIVPALIGAVAGFFLARKMIKKELKKNPPINEKMIRSLYMQVGRKPTEQQIKTMMAQVNKQLK